VDVRRVFEVLSPQVRRKILAYLAEAELTAGEIAGRFNISKPSVSQHLTVLEAAGLVRSEKRSQSLTNTLNGYVQEVCPVSRPLKKESQRLAKSRKGVRKFTTFSSSSRTRGSRLSTSELVESLDSRLRGNDGC
jgi:ArsR family transcriptional regulator, arsenate/arsenite/antimonite-responsive transcriptional repressor